MTVALARAYITLRSQGTHGAAVTSLTARHDAVAPGVGNTLRTFFSNGIRRANALTSLWVTIVAQMGTVTSCAPSFLEVEVAVSTAVTFLPRYSRLAPALSTLFTVKRFRPERVAVARNTAPSQLQAEGFRLTLITALPLNIGFAFTLSRSSVTYL